MSYLLVFQSKTCPVSIKKGFFKTSHQSGSLEEKVLVFIVVKLKLSFSPNRTKDGSEFLFHAKDEVRLFVQCSLYSHI